MSDPIHYLSLNIQCEAPPEELTDRQKFALHEFFHEVLASAYKLYQTVPPNLAADIIRQKFGAMAATKPGKPSA